MPDTATVGDLVTANRILTNEGILDGFGHVTARTPDDTVLVSRYQSSALVSAEDVIELTLEGNVLDDRDVDTYSETAIHRAIYRHRDDVNGVVHHHHPAIMPFTVTDVPFEPAFHLGAIFRGGVPTFDAYDHDDRGRLIVTEAESDRMAESLGDARAQFLDGHGANVVGSTVREAVVASVHFVRNARYLLDARDAGDPSFPTGPDESLAAMERDVVLKPRTVDRLWDHLVATLP